MNMEKRDGRYRANPRLPARYPGDGAIGAADRPDGALAPGYIQANIIILPQAHAASFAEHCRRSAQACPLLTVSEPGDPSLPAPGDGIDICHDLPRYRSIAMASPARCSTPQS